MRPPFWKMAAPREKTDGHREAGSVFSLFFPLDIRVLQDTAVDMDIQALCSSMDNLVVNVQKIQDTIDQKSMLEPRIPIPDLFFGDRTKFLSFRNNCKLFLALKPHSSGNPIQQVLIIISFLRGDPQDWAFSLAPGDSALSNVDAFFQALGLLYDEPNSVDQAEKNLLALCQGQDDVEVYCQKFRKWSVLTLWNESALAALFRKGLSEALKDVMVGFPMPAGLNESMSLAIQIGRRLRERKSLHHLAVLSESKPEPMQCDRTMTKVERQEHRRLNRLCFYCGDSTHAISNCPKRTRRFDSSAVIGTVQSKFLLSITLMCSLSSYSVMAFVDSGAALNLMDLDYAKRCGFFLEPLRCPIPLRGIDATPLAKNKPQYWAQLTMCMAPAHQEVIRFLVLHNLHDVVVLGLPWLQTHNPVLDWNSMSVTSWGCQGVHGDVPFLSISSSIPSDIPEFLSDFQDVFEESKSDALPPHRNCDCAIDLIPGSKFPKGRLFNLSVPEHTSMRSYVKESLEKGHIRPSSSPLGAGFFFVAKKDGSLRPCIDYHLLNKITVKFQYPLPLISDLFARIKGASWFTKIDLRGAYNLVRIRQGDEWKTAFNTPEGHFEYLVMPFGLANAPSVFQSFMHDIFREYLDKFLIVYLDDILIFSDDWESHVKQVRMVFQVEVDASEIGAGAVLSQRGQVASSDCPGVDSVVDRLQQIWTQVVVEEIRGTYGSICGASCPCFGGGELEYIVEKILDSRVSRRKLQYLVKWKGYAQEDNSWVFASDVHAPDLVRAFHVAHPGRPGGSACYYLLLEALRSKGVHRRAVSSARFMEIIWKINNCLFFCFLSTRSVGTFARALDCSSSVRQPSLHMSAAAASRDITLFHAMDTLHKNSYDISKAISALVPQGGPVLCRDEMEEWSASEANLFEEALEKYGKDFTDIQQDFLPWKSLTSIIEYYYMWKTTDRYVQQKRLKAAEAESKLKQVYIPNYNKPNPNQINANSIKPAVVNGTVVQGQNLSGRACESCYMMFVNYCLYSSTILPVVFLGSSEYAVSSLCVMLGILEKVWRIEDANQIGWREAGSKSEQYGTTRLPEASKTPLMLKQIVRKPLEQVLRYIEAHPCTPKPESIKNISTSINNSLTPSKSCPVINNGSPTILGKRSYEQHNGMDDYFKDRSASKNVRLSPMDGKRTLSYLACRKEKIMKQIKQDGERKWSTF
ncbi:unnamed protein product [Ranitomeya imitator]|uniref:ribonuclease H n=1 Tax=Ranitomeya imitator TaxID=111125 RepID=A0ABN9L1M9_9NEOB|nr:unnamed protein product [Ranitomeya imitator]